MFHWQLESDPGDVEGWRGKTEILKTGNLENAEGGDIGMTLDGKNKLKS